MFYDSYLNSNQLSGSIPSTIGSLTNLVQLYENHLNIITNVTTEHEKIIIILTLRLPAYVIPCSITAT